MFENLNGRGIWQWMVAQDPTLSPTQLSTFWKVYADISHIADAAEVKPAVIIQVLGNYDPESDTLG